MPGITVLYTPQPTKPSSIHYASPIESFFPPSSSRQNSSEPATKHAFTAFLLSAFRAPLLFFTCMAFCNTRITARSRYFFAQRRGLLGYERHFLIFLSIWTNSACCYFI